MIKVLHIMNGAKNGGISMYVSNMYKYINKDNIHFDCAVYDDNLGINGENLKKMGCIFYKLPLKSRHPIKYYIALKKIIIDGKYNVVHVHQNESSVYPLMISKRCNVKGLISHAHTYRVYKSIFGKTKNKISQLLLKKYSTKRIACSSKAALSIFGTCKDVIIQKNAIDTNLFQFDERKRIYIRKELGIDNKFVIGCVGNLGKEKNFDFAIGVFSNILKKANNAMLVIIGDGPEKNNLIELAEKLRITDKTLFLGKRSDVNILLQGMDVFLMPSKYEGFGIAALEAATSRVTNNTVR